MLSSCKIHTTMNMAPYLEKIGRGCLWSRDEKSFIWWVIVKQWKEVIWDLMESCNTRYGRAWHVTYLWPVLVDVLRHMHVCAVYSYTVQLGCVPFSAFTWCFWLMKLYISKLDICIMLIFFLVSIVLEQIYTFKTNTVAELTV